MQKSNLDLWIEEQKAYRFTNNLRKVTLILSWILTIIVIIVSRNENGNIFEKILGSCMIGSAIHASVHAEFLFKKATNALGIIGLFACCVIWGLFVIVGCVFMIVDTVLFIMKKPLIYPFEYKSFLNIESVRQEIQNMQWDAENLENKRKYSVENLKILSEMLENGLISEDEYAQKKADLLNKF